MKNWMSGIRGAILMIGLWVVGWGLGFGGIMEAFIDPDGKVGDIWPVMLAMPGFIGGVVFAALLLVAERRNTFDQIPFFHYALWGAAAGIALGLLSIPAEVGDVSPGWAGMTGIATALGIVSGLGCGIFSRFATRRRTLTTP